MQRTRVIALSLGVLVIATTVGAVVLANREPDAGPARDTHAPNIVRPGAPGSSSSTIAPGDPGLRETIAPTQADVDFVEGMIHHHQQALVMVDYVVAHGSSAGIKVLARRLKIGQDSEIKQMQLWLKDNSSGSSHGKHGQLMPGMLTAGELSRLAAARGRESDRLFLQYMIRHHQGALTMIEQLYAASGGSQSELDLLVRHIDTDQTIEITRMRQLLRNA